MSEHKRQMHFGVFVLGTGNHSAGWRMEGAFTSGCRLPVLQNIATTAERGKFDLFFISDGLLMETNDHPSFVSRFEPLTLLSALSMVTKHVGLGATVSTSFGEPYHVARAFASLDHLSNGRAGWNVVTSANQKAALNFSKQRLDEHDLRYEIASEFVDVVRGLWDCWDDGAVVADLKTGVYLDKSKIHPLDHKGRFYQVKGPLNIERSPQGQPVIIQAGGSPAGQDLSARSADLVFSVVNGDKESAKTAYDSLKQRVVKHGRDPHELPILPGVMPIIADTDEQAKEQLAKLQSWLTPTNALALVSARLGHDISGYPLDGPVPDFPQTEGGQAFSRALLDMARREKMTLRDLYNVTAAARGHWVIYGTPKRIADTLEEWFTSGLADGFVIMPAYFPGAFDDFVDRVVPELQRRGLYRTEYSGTTLRSHLGLERPGVMRRQAAS
ncbi:LLM class flavin-dependent oxidoreductase [Rhodoplanes sp. Z2-YC6860]|uniref:LLM class flavin-dependent oxidoreductase n=1 Tax=Rhodoplanes sp. Z2-YC6860 TaxID=674703 RepID=UPI00078C20C1|nr:LLM class flavin-dependent oxidoreductase [Rhodoplanes sp. Z2-YC6860]AMN40585.1 monooxygenase [Rhodoplanes sp. Z2-YC6860]